MAQETTIRALFFGRLSESVGGEPLGLTVAAETTAGALRATLAERYPAARAALATCMIAVNRDFASDDRMLADGDEVAFLPPVSGG
jgi:sulfur-carrier protein